MVGTCVHSVHKFCVSGPSDINIFCPEQFCPAGVMEGLESENRIEFLLVHVPCCMSIRIGNFRSAINIFNLVHSQGQESGGLT